jgi:hypothetical protein
MQTDISKPPATDDTPKDLAANLERVVSPDATIPTKAGGNSAGDVQARLDEIANLEKQRLAVEVERLDLIKQRRLEEKEYQEMLHLVHGTLAEVQVAFDDLEKSGSFGGTSSSVERTCHMATLISRLDTVMRYRKAISDPELLQQISRLHSRQHEYLYVHWKGDDPVEMTRKKAQEVTRWIESVRKLEQKAKTACESAPKRGDDVEVPEASHLDELSHELGELYKRVTAAWGTFLEILPHDKALPRQCLEDLAGCLVVDDRSQAAGSDPIEICQTWFSAIALVHPDSKHGIAAELAQAADRLKEWKTSSDSGSRADAHKKPLGGKPTRESRPKVKFSGVASWSDEKEPTKDAEPPAGDPSPTKKEPATTDKPTDKPAKEAAETPTQTEPEPLQAPAPQLGSRMLPVVFGCTLVLAIAAAGYLQQRQAASDLRQAVQQQHEEFTKRLENQEQILREQFASQLKTEGAALREQLPAQLKPGEESLRQQLELFASKLNTLEEARAKQEAKERERERIQEATVAHEQTRIQEETRARELAEAVAKAKMIEGTAAPAKPTPKPVAAEKPTEAPVAKPKAAAAALKRPLPANAKPMFVNSLGMTFVPVMIEGGQTNGQVVYFSQFETRTKEFNAFVKADKYAWTQPKKPQPDDHPAVNVHWDDAREFCEWLARKEVLPYRLPSDHEWSMAVGGLEHEESLKVPKEKDSRSPNVFPWGNLFPPPLDAGNYAYPGDGFEKTAPVGSFSANAHKLHDMGGNVWEWCYDEYVPNKGDRVLRGGSWLLKQAPYMLSSYRLVLAPTSRFDYYGFRVAFTLPITGLPESGGTDKKKTEKKQN